MNDEKSDGFAITDVITRAPKWLDTPPIESIFTRLIMADPSLLDKVKINCEKSLMIGTRKVVFHFGDIHNFKDTVLDTRFDACILATSKQDINDTKLTQNLRKISKLIFSVAESKLPESLAYYVNLQGMGEKFQNSRKIKCTEGGLFHFGSCQSNGWHSTLRLLLQTFEQLPAQDIKFHSLQSDIVHPDTPTGSLGTRTMNPRDQEARNNLRPGGSQVKISMDRLFPESNNFNSISLRTLIEPPGFQINRFFFSYTSTEERRLKHQDFFNVAYKIENQHSHILTCSSYPFGSRAFAGRRTAACLLTDSKYLDFVDDFSSLEHERNLSMLITQSYVDNVKGYCNSVLVGASIALAGHEIDVF